METRSFQRFLSTHVQWYRRKPFSIVVCFDKRSRQYPVHAASSHEQVRRSTVEPYHHSHCTSYVQLGSLHLENFDLLLPDPLPHRILCIHLNRTLPSCILHVAFVYCDHCLYRSSRAPPTCLETAFVATYFANAHVKQVSEPTVGFPVPICHWHVESCSSFVDILRTQHCLRQLLLVFATLLVFPLELRRLHPELLSRVVKKQMGHIPE